MLKKFLSIFIILCYATTINCGADSSSAKYHKRTTISIKSNKRIKPLSIVMDIESYYIHDSCELYISFPESEGWANLVVTTISGELVFKDRFHTAFEFCKYIGIPEEPWKIEITTTGGGDYEGWLIL